VTPLGLGCMLRGGVGGTCGFRSDGNTSMRNLLTMGNPAEAKKFNVDVAATACIDGTMVHGSSGHVSTAQSRRQFDAAMPSSEQHWFSETHSYRQVHRSSHSLSQQEVSAMHAQPTFGSQLGFSAPSVSVGECAQLHGGSIPVFFSNRYP
jgi:hypothetical protein